MLEEEMNERPGYEKYKHSNNPDSRNGYRSKEVVGIAGSITIGVPQNRLPQRRRSGITYRKNFTGSFCFCLTP